MSDKKILIVGPDYYGYNEGVEKAFNKKGYSTKLVPFIEGDIPITGIKFVDRILLKLNRPHFEKKYAEKVNKEIIEAVDQYKPDVFFSIKGSTLDEKSLKYINEKCDKTMLWMMDSIFRVPQSLATAHLYDYNFMFEDTDVQRLKEEYGIKSYFLALGFDDTVYFPQEKEKDVDISFVGNFIGCEDRVTLLKNIVSDFPDKNIAIYGKYIEHSKPITFYNYYIKGDKKYYKNRSINPEQVNNLYAQSKIVLNLHFEQSKEGCNPRFYEIIGTKAFELVDNIPFIDKNYKGEVVTYENYDELREKIKYFLENDKERDYWRELSYEKIAKKNTFVSRIEQVIDITGI